MDEATRSALITELDEVGNLQASLAREVEAALVEIGREEDAARKAMEEAQRRLMALAEVRAEYEDRRGRLDVEGVDRERAAVAEGLRRDRERLEARGQLLVRARQDRLAEAQAQVDGDADLAAALVEVARFREMEAGLDKMPPSYRQALVERHGRAYRRLSRVSQLVSGPLLPLGGPAAGVGVVLAVEPPRGRAEAMVIVLPVAFRVYTEWSDRGEDLATHLAYRTVAGLYLLLGALGAAAAPVRYLEVYGNLAIQVWLGDFDVGEDLADRAVDALATAWDHAGELVGAGLEVYTVQLRPQLLADPEEA